MKSELVLIGLIAVAVLWAGNEWTETLPQPNSSVTLTSSQPVIIDAKPVEMDDNTPVGTYSDSPTESNSVASQEPKQIEPSILMHSSSDCIHCDRWWAQRADWERLGWRVEKVIDIAPVEGHRVWPWFKIRDRDVEFTVDGFMDGSRFNAARKKALIR